MLQPTIVDGFLQACREAGLTESQVTRKLAAACGMLPEFADAVRKQAADPVAAKPSLSEALIPALALGAAGAGYGAWRAPGKSRLRGALIGGLGGAGAGAAFSGANALLDSSQGRHLQNSGVNAALVLGGAGLGLHGGLSAGRGLAEAAGLGDSTDQVKNDLAEMDVLDNKKTWVPHSLQEYLQTKKADTPALGAPEPPQFHGTIHNPLQIGQMPPGFGAKPPAPAPIKPVAPPISGAGTAPPPAMHTSTHPWGPTPSVVQNPPPLGAGGLETPQFPEPPLQTWGAAAQRFTGNRQVNPQTGGEVSVPPQPRSLLNTVGAAGRSAVGTVGMLPAMVGDAAAALMGDRSQSPQRNALGLDQTGAMFNDALALPNQLAGTHIGVNAAPPGSIGNINPGPSRGRSFFAEQADPVTGQLQPSMLELGVQHAQQGATLPNEAGGTTLGRASHAVMGGALQGSKSALPLIVGGAGLKAVGALPGAAGYLQSVGPGMAGWGAAGAGADSLTNDGLDPQKSQAIYQQMHAADGQVAATLPIAGQHAVPSENPAPPENPAVAQQPHEQLQALNEQAAQLAADPAAPPEAKQDVAKQSVILATANMHGSPEAAADFANRAATGQLTPTEEQSGFSNFVEQSGAQQAEPGVVQHLLDGWAKMGETPGMQALFALGLGAGLIGLIHSLSGEGGISSWLVTALGAGGAAYMGANSGMFGQQAQGMAQNATGSLSSLFGGQPSTLTHQPGGDAAKSEAGHALPGGQLPPGLQMLLTHPDQSVQQAALQEQLLKNPELKGQLESLHSAYQPGFLNNMTGIPRNMATQEAHRQIGANPQQTQQLVDLYDRVRPALQAQSIPARTADPIHRVQGQANVNGNIP